MNLKDKKYFELLGKALNPPPKKISKIEKLKSFNLASYLDFLEQGRLLMVGLKGKLSTSSATAAETIYRQGVKLGFVKYHASKSKLS